MESQTDRFLHQQAVDFYKARQLLKVRLWKGKFTVFRIQLKAWFLLEFFSCDADPAALAKYVVALVKKDKPVEELKDICVDQLEVFLSSGNILITN